MRLKSFLNRLRVYAYAYMAANILSDAFSLASNGDFSKALNKVQSAEKYLDLPFEGKLLKGFLLYKNMRLHCAYDLLEHLESSISVDPKKYRKDEVNYMTAYSRAIREVIIIATDCHDKKPPEIHFENINLENVRKHLKRNFPLVGHPDWSKFSM